LIVHSQFFQRFDAAREQPFAARLASGKFSPIKQLHCKTRTSEMNGCRRTGHARSDHDDILHGHSLRVQTPLTGTAGQVSCRISFQTKATKWKRPAPSGVGLFFAIG
jgi:hypothetical protein